MAPESSNFGEDRGIDTIIAVMMAVKRNTNVESAGEIREHANKIKRVNDHIKTRRKGRFVL